MAFLKNIIYIIVFGIIIFLTYFYFAFQEDSFDKEHLKLYSLYFKKHNEYIYIHTYSFGLLGNHSKIIISKNKIKNAAFRSKRDIVVKGISTVFYKKTHDTLYLFWSCNITIPTNFDSKIKIVQKELENVEMIKLMETYPSNGLKQIRIE